MMPTIITRRAFLRHAGAAAGCALFSAAFPFRGSGRSPLSEGRDEEILWGWLDTAAAQGLQGKPIGDVVAAAGRYFLGVRYVAHTLEVPGEEHLVVNLREFDCTTFMENSFVLARCVKRKVKSFGEYRQELQSVRYRGGKIDGYASRLHYTTDWMKENEKAKRLRLLARELGGSRSRKMIDFMTTHPDSYAQLSNPEIVRRIATIEQTLTKSGFYFIPRTKLAGASAGLQNGDLIGTVTPTPGLDISHTGIAVREGTSVKFLHASLSGGKVVLSNESLADYVAGHRSMEGIVAARPLEPDAANSH